MAAEEQLAQADRIIAALRDVFDDTLAEWDRQQITPIARDIIAETLTARDAEAAAVVEAAMRWYESISPLVGSIDKLGMSRHVPANSSFVKILTACGALARARTKATINAPEDKI